MVSFRSNACTTATSAGSAGKYLFISTLGVVVFYLFHDIGQRQSEEIGSVRAAAWTRWYQETGGRAQGKSQAKANPARIDNTVFPISFGDQHTNPVTLTKFIMIYFHFATCVVAGE
jgi:hypothetical protein